MQEQDTIAQIITAQGKAAVGIIRMSGSRALEIGAKLYQGKEDVLNCRTHSICYGHVLGQEAEAIDEALFMIMHAPRTYTGEDVVEIQCHGGYVATQEVLNQTFKLGARPAAKGEFSKRAFLNGKLDFTQAEAIMDLIDARSDGGLKLALQQKQGQLRDKIKDLRADFLNLIAFLQADIDYPEDDIERLDAAQMLARGKALLTIVNDFLATALRGRLYQKGIRIALAGRPNVGKSSLLNALVGRETAIVTDIEGTTRDVLKEEAIIGDFVVEFLDTAGLRETADVVESIGIERAKEITSQADVIVYIIGADEGFTKEDCHIIQGYEQDKLVLVCNKIDLQTDAECGAKSLDLENPLNGEVLLISAKTGEGMDQLCKAIEAHACQGKPASADDFYITNSRHLALLDGIKADLVAYLKGVENQLSADFLVIDLINAWESLGLITGETADESLIDEIFSQFCLGK